MTIKFRVISAFLSAVMIITSSGCSDNKPQSTRITEDSASATESVVNGENATSNVEKTNTFDSMENTTVEEKKEPITEKENNDTTSTSTKATTTEKQTDKPVATAPASTKPAVQAAPATTVQSVKVDNATPAPEWTESAVSGTRYVNTAGIYSRARAVLGAEKVKSYGLNDMVTVTAETNTGYYKLADGSFIHKDYLSTSKIVVKADTTTKKQITTPAPSTTKATTTTKKQNTSPKPAETTKRQGVTPTVDKTPVQEPTEEEIWDKMSAAEKREYFDHMAERIAYYLGVHRGNTEIILLPGLSNYAYERTQQVKEIGGGHSAENCNALAAELKYGIYYQKGEWAGLKKGWNMPGASEGMAGSVGFVGFSEESINKEADRIVQAFSESAGHWSYLGDANSKYVGVGYSEGGVIILVSNENCDVVNEKLLECNGDVDLYWEKYDAGEFEIY